MNPKFFEEKIVFVSGEKREKTLSEMETEIRCISERIAELKRWGLSVEVTALAIREMREQIKILKALMHNRVNDL